MGPFYPTAAYSSETIWLYLAKGLVPGEQKLDEGEFLDVQTVPLADLVRDILDGKVPDGDVAHEIGKRHGLVRDILDGKVPDGKTQAAVMRAWAMEKGL